MKPKLTIARCTQCGAPWLGAFWNVPECNACRAMEQQPHELPSEEEINDMYAAFVESEVNAYRTAH